MTSELQQPETENKETSTGDPVVTSEPPANDHITPLPPAKKGQLIRQLFLNLHSGLRASLFLRVGADRWFRSTADLAVVALADFLLNLAVSFLLLGKRGVFSVSAVETFFFHLPLFLLLGFLVGKWLSRPELTTFVPVALISLSIPIELTHAALEASSQVSRLSWLIDYLEAPHYYRFFWWWAVTALLFLVRSARSFPTRRRMVLPLLFLLLVVPALWYFPRPDLWVSSGEGAESGELHVTEEVLGAQARLLDGQLAGLRHGVQGETDLYFVGFAGDATQDVFLKELSATERLFSTRFGAYGRTVMLVNNPKTGSTLPFATNSNLARALARVGQVMNRDEDILFLYLTSHGSKEHELSVNNQPLELKGLTPDGLKRIVQGSGIKWKVVVVSACYSGGFLAPLKDENTVVITAADANHESFGCGNGENFTWFGSAYVDDALRHTYSFTKAFKEARKLIRTWEREQGETESNPQMWVGKAIAPKLAALSKRLEEEGKQEQEQEENREEE
ncbi:C13 family peptidase [Geomonas sp.]|uniref:C13 family peptidase n=1 Tax=Geomonas sp. TaxID=2651584 RepID=UPI002B47F86E|nr:C13 family peptidase [Geomonas sp.]